MCGIDRIMNTLGQKDPEQILITGENVKYKMELKRGFFIPGDKIRQMKGWTPPFQHWPASRKAWAFFGPLFISWVVITLNLSGMEEPGSAYVGTFVVIFFFWSVFVHKAQSKMEMLSQWEAEDPFHEPLDDLELRSPHLLRLLGDFRDASTKEKRTYLEHLSAQRRIFAAHIAALPEWVQALEDFPIQEIVASSDAETGTYLKEEWKGLYDYFLHATPEDVEKFLEWKFPELIEQCKYKGVLPKGYRNPFEESLEAEQEKARQAEEDARAKAQAADDFLDELKAHVDEAFKQGEPQEAEAGYEEQQETSSSYTPEQDAARQRFGLPVGFTWEQLKVRYVEMVGDEEFSDMEKLNKDYEILLFAARDDDEDKDKDKD